MLTLLVAFVGYVVVATLIEIVYTAIPKRIKSVTEKLVGKAILAFLVLFPIVAVCICIAWREWVWAVVAALLMLLSIRIWRKERKWEEEWEKTKIEMEARGIPTETLD